MNATSSPGASRSYASGGSSHPLLGQTIGENFRQTVDRFPNQDALVVRFQNYRATEQAFVRFLAISHRNFLFDV